MHIAPMSEVLVTPALGSFLGTSASVDVLSHLNNQYGNQGGVIFGQPGDPYLDNFNYFQELIHAKFIKTEAIVQATTQAIDDPYRIQEITSEQQLFNTPVSMQLPILMFEPIRQLFMDDRIYGYGFNKDYLPAEDDFGRLINNGSVVYDRDHYEDGKIPEFVEEEWRSTDPKLSFDELDAIEATRDWMLGYLRQQMSEHGEMRDPTDPSNKISQLRKRKKK